jgi:hypothetical protein
LRVAVSSVVEDPHQRVAAVVRHMYLVERIPARVIVLKLRAMGIVDGDGQPFDLARVMEMVRNMRPRPRST